MSLRVMLVDDHPVVRDGIRCALERADSPIEVVGECGSAEEALSALETREVEVVLMDVRLPGMSGLEATRAILEAHPAVKVVLVTGLESDLFLTEAVKAGASGFLLKGAPGELVAMAVVAAVKGGIIVPPALLSQALARVPGRDVERTQSGPGLSPRELEVLLLLAQGHANKEIASRLNLAESTVKKYVQGVVGKLNARDRTHAATLALRMGLID